MATEKLITIKIKTDVERNNIGKITIDLKKLTNERNSLLKKVSAGNKLTKIETKRLGELQPQLVATRNKLRDMERSVVKNNNALKKNSGFVHGVKNGMVKAAGSIALMAGGAFALVGVIRNVTKTVIDFDKSQGELRAITGKTKEELSGLESQAKKLGKTTKFTATETTNAQIELAKLGFTIKEITKLTPAVLNLASATGTDLAEAATVAGSTVRGFGLDASETQRVVDVMANSFTKTSLDMSKFTTAMATVAPVAKNAGLGVEETTALLGTLTDVGLDASTAGTGLRNVFLELTKKGLTFDEAMRKIQTSTNKNATSLALFGKRGATVGTVLAENTKKTEDLTTALNSSGGAAERMANEQLSTLSGRFTLLSSAWDGFVLGLEDGSGKLSGFFKGAVDFATSLLNSFTGVNTSVGDNITLLQKEQTKVFELTGKASQLNLKSSERIKIIAQLKKDYPGLLGFIKEEASDNETLQKAITVVNKNISKRLAIQKILKPQEEAAIRLAEKRKLVEHAKRDFLLENSKIEKTLAERIAFSNLTEKQQIEFAIKNAQVRDDLANAANKVKLAELFLNAEQKKSNRVTKETNKLLANLITTKEELDLLNDNELTTLIKSKALKDKGLDADARSILILRQRAKVTEDITTVTVEETVAATGLIEAQKKLLEQAKKLPENTVKEIAAKNDKIKAIKEEISFLQNLTDKDLERGRVAKLVAKDVVAIAENENTELIPITETRKQQAQDISDFFQGLSQQEIEETNRRLEARKQALQLFSEFSGAINDNLKNKADRDAAREVKLVQRTAKGKLAILKNQLDKGLISEQEFSTKKTELDKQTALNELNIRKAAFEKKKKFDTAFNVLEYIKELASLAQAAAANPLNGVTFGGAGTAQYLAQFGLATARFGFRQGEISSQQFAKGGVLQGNSHANGGIPFSVNGKAGFEAEGGEALINKVSTKRFRPLLSAINEAGGGRSFALGGIPNVNNTPQISDTNSDLIEAINTRFDRIEVINVATNTIDTATEVFNIEADATF